MRRKRVMGIEPTCPAWKAGVLPLNYTRKRSININFKSGWQDSNLRLPGPKPGALAKLSHTPSPRRHFALAQRLIIILKTFCFVNRVFQFLIICLKAVQTGCISTLNWRRVFIFIEKRISFPMSQKMQLHFWSLSRICNVFLTKMYALRRSCITKTACLYCSHNRINTSHRSKSNDVKFTESILWTRRQP